jgi:hypothetical protein
MSNRPFRYELFLARRCDQALALRLFPFEFAYSTQSLAFLSRCLLGGFLVETPTPHLAEHAFPLHLPFQHFEGLIDIVVTYEYLQNLSPAWLALIRVDAQVLP